MKRLRTVRHNRREVRIGLVGLRLGVLRKWIVVVHGLRAIVCGAASLRVERPARIKCQVMSPLRHG